jgi:tetratricopeptide (TPR) repeat protein
MVKSKISALSWVLFLCLSRAVPAADTGAALPGVLGMESMEITDQDSRDLVKDGAAAVPSASEYQSAIEKYRQAVRATETNQGAYGDQLWEQLVGLGVSLQHAGQHQEAVASLNQALHINRVNHGLHDLNQEPIIDLLINSNSALSDWEALDQNYHYLYWLYRRVYGTENMRLLPVINRVGLWHLNAYNLGESDNPLAHLLAAQTMYSDAVNIIETNQGPYDAGVIAPLYGIMLTNYMMAVHASSTDDPEELRTSITISNQSYSRCDRNSYFRRNPYFDNCYGSLGMAEEEASRQELVNTSYRSGKKALNRMIEVYENNPTLPAAEHAMAYIRMGDWYMLFNRPSSATKTYETAYALLENADAEANEKLFGAPRSLPELQFTLTNGNEPGPAEKYVVISMDISETGKARNIQVLESNPPDDKHLILQARENLRYSRFRPRFENGEPVPTTGYKKMYVFK